MESSITPARIANSILQDNSYDGYYLLVEGKKDVPLYRKLMRTELVKLKPTFGKYKMREAISILNKRGFNKKFAIRDADFIRVRNNYCINYDQKIFITDCHDAESMIINQTSLTDFLNTVSSEEKITSFEDVHGEIRALLYKLAYPIGCLRLANKIHNLGLSFKPEKPEGNKFKIKNIISEKNFTYLGDAALIKTIIDYSVNRGNDIADNKTIANKLNEISALNHPQKDIVNGHDLSQILLMICKKGLKSTHKSLIDADCIESMLTLAFGCHHFKKTELFTSILNYQNDENTNLIEM